MNKHANLATAAKSALVKADPNTPALLVTGRDAIAIKPGTIFAGRTFDQDTHVPLPAEGLSPGADYGVVVTADAIKLEKLTFAPLLTGAYIGGFHFAPGGNAAGRSGGDEQPAINPFSVWDVNFRPACDDPRGMVLVEKPGQKFWCDIYLLGTNHLGDGTSKFGATIADGDDPPQKSGTEDCFDGLDYATAVEVMKHHGKGLLSVEEFFAVAFGVTEKTARDKDPKKTGLDAPRTSKFGVMQATGNLWAWGHDGDPDMPRASLFGGAWWVGDSAGSRSAGVACNWPDDSDEDVGARGRSDHLQPG